MTQTEKRALKFGYVQGWRLGTRVENGTTLNHLDVRVHPDESRPSKTSVNNGGCDSLPLSLLRMVK
jgi:hypothetical protein